MSGESGVAVGLARKNPAPTECRQGRGRMKALLIPQTSDESAQVRCPRRRAARPARPIPAAVRATVEGSGTRAAVPGEPILVTVKGAVGGSTERIVVWLIPPFSPASVPIWLTTPAVEDPTPNPPDGV